MKASITFISYCPDVVRGETFRVGLILRCDEAAYYKTRVSEKRIRRIAKAFDVRDSALLRETVHSLAAKPFDDAYLTYLADYENGIVRYSKPQTIATDAPEETFGQLYAAYIQDTDETKQPSTRSATKFHKVLKKHRAIGNHYKINFTLRPEMTGGLLPKNHRIDVIGKNGAICVGQMLPLDNDNTIAQCLMTFRAIEGHFRKQNLYAAEGCMMIVRRPADVTEEQQRRLDAVSKWRDEEGYTLIEDNSPETIADKLAEIAGRKNIRPFAFDEQMEIA